MQQAYDRREKNWTLGVTALASFMMALNISSDDLTTGLCHHSYRLQRTGRDTAMGGQRL